MLNPFKYDAIVIGGSAGSLNALTELFCDIPETFDRPVLSVVHLHHSDEGGLAEVLNRKMKITVKEAEEKEDIRPGIFYIGPSDYHLLVEPDKTLSLSRDEKVNFARPSIDVLFESAAFAYADRLLGIILTGCNHDGARGISKIKQYGGCTIAQNPLSADYPVMPQAAIDTGDVDRVLNVREIFNIIADRVKE